MAAVMREGDFVEARLARVESDVEHIRGDLSEVKTDIRELKKNAQGLKGEVAALRSEMKEGFAKLCGEMNLLGSDLRREMLLTRIWTLAQLGAMAVLIARAFKWI